MSTKKLPYLKFTLGSSSSPGKRTELVYELFENHFTPRWLEALKIQIENNHPIWEGGLFYGRTFYRQEDIVQQMKDCFKILDEYRKDCFRFESGLEPHVGIKTEELNLIHSRFEALDRLPEFQRPIVPEPVMTALQRVNTLVHRLEQYLQNRGGAFIEVLYEHFQKEPLLDEDYKLFTPDFHFGYLYLTYGTTGVPVVNAFYNRPESPPVPQSTYSPGMNLSFRSTRKFPDWPGVERFLRETYGWDVKDPRLAIGYIPLGQLISDCKNWEELEPSLRGFDQVLSVELTTQRPNEKPVKWPYQSEIFHQLDLVPYLDLKLDFDHQGCLQEAMALLDRFISHRDYDQSSQTDQGGKWKSLAIRALEGDSTKTLHHSDYGYREKPDLYRLTEIAALCPKTIAFLSQLTDIDQCDRIRFMLLEPGAKIRVHSDAKEKSVVMAINIALNMPDGCDFYIDTNPDGTHNAYTRKVPFRDGTGMYVNVAKYHYLENRSSIPRIHIIVHGPIRISDSELISLAREQNGLHSEKDVIGALVRKSSRLGKPPVDGSPLMDAFLRQGLKSDSLPASIKILVIDDPIEGDPALQTECRERMTRASLFPLRYEILRPEELDPWLRRQDSATTEAVVILFAGNLITRIHPLIVGVIGQVAEMQEKGIVVRGHIMNWARKSSDLPYLHEQFTILNFRKWKELGEPSFGVPYSRETIEFSDYVASNQCVHDDYTPLWLKRGPGRQKRTGLNWWGTEVIRASLEHEIPVENIPDSIRNTKMYAYPKSREKKEYQAVKARIEETLRACQKQVFVFNNEPLLIPAIPGFEPDELLTVSSGLKPAAILRQYWQGNRSPQAVHVVDYSAKSLEYQRGLCEQDTMEAMTEYLFRWTYPEHGESSEKKEDVRKMLVSHLQMGFLGSFGELRSALRKMRNVAKFHEVDFLSDHSVILSKLSSSKKTIFWHSNAWYSNPAYYRRTEQELMSDYRALALLIGRKFGWKAWIHRGGKSVIFGETKTDIRVFLTDGCVSSDSFFPDEYGILGVDPS